MAKQSMFSPQPKLDKAKKVVKAYPIKRGDDPDAKPITQGVGDGEKGDAKSFSHGHTLRALFNAEAAPVPKARVIRRRLYAALQSAYLDSSTLKTPYQWIMLSDV